MRIDKETPCGESKEVNDAWTNARSQAWIQEKSREDVHKDAYDAAKEALADMEDSAEMLTCIGVYAGVSTGIHECDVIDKTAEFTSEIEGIDEEQAHQWAEQTVAEIYSEWWTSYEEICPVKEEESKSLKTLITHFCSSVFNIKINLYQVLVILNAVKGLMPTRHGRMLSPTPGST